MKFVKKLLKKLELNRQTLKLMNKVSLKLFLIKLLFKKNLLLQGRFFSEGFSKSEKQPFWKSFEEKATFEIFLISSLPL